MKRETGRKVKHRSGWGDRLSSVLELLPRVYFTVTALFISPNIWMTDRSSMRSEPVLRIPSPFPPFLFGYVRVAFDPQNKDQYRFV